MKLLGGTFNKAKRSSFYLPEDNVYLGSVKYNLGYFYYTSLNKTLSESSSFQDFFVSFNNNKIFAVTDVGDAIAQYKLTNPEDISTAVLVDSLTTIDTSPQSVIFGSNGTKAYVLGATNRIIYQYTLSVAWDITTASFDSKSFNVGSQETGPTGLAFSTDGTKCYVVGTTTATIYQYNLSVAWDISTASYSSKSFSLAGYESSPTGIAFKSDGTKFYVVGIGGFIVYQFTLTTDWDMSTAVSDLKQTSILAQDTISSSLYFKPDGTQVYLIGQATNTVYQYTLSTAWDISTLSYDNKSLIVSSWDALSTSLFFKSDGTKLYIGGDTNDRVRSFTLRTAWDISTAYYQLSTTAQTSSNPMGLDFSSDGTKAYVISTAGVIYQYTLNTAGDTNTAYYSGKSLTVSTQDSAPMGVKFSSDGTKAYIIGDTNNTIYQYTLSTAWDISTGSYASKSLTITTQDALPTDLAFSSDGTKAYVLGDTNNTIYQYTLSTAWDISTGTYATKSFAVTTQTTAPNGIAFSSDGTKCYVSTYTTTTVFQYTLSTAWDISTTTYASKSLLFTSYDTNASAVSINSTGTKLYVLGVTNKLVHTFTLATPYDLATATNTAPENYSTSTLDASLTGVAFSSDGTLMYTSGDTNDRIYQYKLSVAWDASTAIPFRQTLLISGQEATSYDMTFSSDGTKAYISGTSVVYQYNLSSAWNISTATYASKSLTTSTQDTASRAITFKSDGTAFYMAGQTNDTVYQYTLSTAWDISTATYATKSVLISARETTVTGIYFKSDGLSLYVMGDTNDRVDQFNLTVAWDVSTATYASKTFSIGTQEATASALFFNPDGSSFYIVGTTTDTIYQYNLSSAWDISTASYSGKSYLISSLEPTSSGLFFSSDGTSCFIVGNASDTINQLNLATAWDISTANLGYLSVLTEDTSTTDLCFNSSGTRLYVLGNTNDRINQYNLSVPWNVGSGTFSTFVSITKQENTPLGLFLGNNGTRMYILGSGSDRIYSYILQTPDELSSLYVPASLTLSDTSPRDICFNSSGSKFYISGNTTTTIQQYELSTPWDITTTTYSSKSFSTSLLASPPTGVFLKSDGGKIYVCGSQKISEIVLLTNEDISTAQKNYFSISSQETLVSGLTFSTDGTKAYIVGQTNDTIYQYNLSIAWNINSASYSNKSFNISLLDGTSASLTFNLDGTKVFLVGSTNDRIHELILSTAWDISTAYYRKSLYVGSQDTGVLSGAIFGNSGYNLYVLGDTNNTVYQYNLTTPYDLFTATYSSKSFSVSAFEATFNGLYISSDGKQFFVMGDDNNRVYQFSLSTAWDLSTAYSIYTKKYSPLARETSPEGLAIGDSGTKLYVVGTGSNTVFQFNLSTPYQISTATYANKSFSTATWASNATSVSFNPTGTKMYVIGYANDYVREYKLSTAWDVSTAAESYFFKSTSAQALDPNDLFLGNNGTKLYVLTNNIIYQYTLSTPNLVTSATYDSKTFTTTTHYEANVLGFTLKSDGTKLYINGTTNDRIGEYLLTTPWDITTAITPYKSLSVSARDTNPYDLCFGDSGLKLYILGQTNDTIYQYNLTVAYDISTATFATKSFSVTSQETVPSGIAFSSDGTKCYIVGTASDNIRQYTLSTAWDISTASYSTKTLSILTQDTTSAALAFSSDGTKAYIIGDTNNTIYQYTLSTAWDISTGSYASKSLNVTTQEGNPSGMCFNPTGTILYVGGFSTDAIYQYTLSTAWDISTATYASKSVSIVLQDGDSRGIAINSDGTAIYVIGGTTALVWQFPIGTAYDISTTNIGYVTVVTQDTTSAGIFFKPDGTRIYMVGQSNDRVFEYNLSVAWQVSTATYSRQSVVLAELSAGGVYFKDDGTKFYVVGSANDRIYEYSMSSAWDVTTATVNSFSVSIVNDDATSTGIVFDSTGSNVYIVGQGSDGVYQYPLETSWTVRAINNGFVSVNAQDGTPQGFCFSNDGSKLFMVGTSNVTKYIYQYDLSVPFLVSSAVYSKSSGTAVSGYDSITRGIEITPDGTSIFMIGSTNDSIYQINLATPNDVASISLAYTRSITNLTTDPSDLKFNNDGTKLYVSSTNIDIFQFDLTTPYDLSTIITGSSGATTVGTQDALPTDLAFSSDGTKLYALGDTNNTIYQYTLSQPWNISSITYASKSFAVTTQDALPRGLIFSSDGSNCYVIGNTNNTVYQYNLSTAWDISTASYSGKSLNISVYGTTYNGLSFNDAGTILYATETSSARILHYDLSFPWDLSTAYLGYLNIAAVENTVYGISFDNEGSKLFLIGSQNNRIIQYDLSTPWYLYTATLNSNSFFNISTSSVGISDTILTNVSFNEVGTKLYVYGATNNKLYQFNVAFT